MIKKCCDREFETIYRIINEAAQVYKGIIPVDRFHDPYMSMEELRREINDGVVFWGYYKENELIGLMGLQNVQDVTLVRHAYVYPEYQNQGIGSKLLSHLLEQTTLPVFVGTWAAADWAISFYEKQGFRQVAPEEKDRLLKKYWSIPDRQIETSVVLAEAKDIMHNER